MHVRVPTLLQSYTRAADVQVAVPVLAPELPPTLGGVMAALDGAYPGIRFRMIDEQDAIRRHIRVWVNKDEARTLDVPLKATDEVIIFQALSGG